ncbi:MAG: hypothetical protein AB7V27_13665 [Candidatus Binatia bacterium]
MTKKRTTGTKSRATARRRTGTAGISNRPPDDERTEQEEVPERGQARRTRH